MPACRHAASSASALGVSKAARLPTDEEASHAAGSNAACGPPGCGYATEPVGAALVRTRDLRLPPRVRGDGSHKRAFVEADGACRDEKGSAPPRGARPCGTRRPMDRQRAARRARLGVADPSEALAPRHQTRRRHRQPGAAQSPECAWHDTNVKKRDWAASPRRSHHMLVNVKRQDAAPPPRVHPATSPSQLRIRRYRRPGRLGIAPRFSETCSTRSCQFGVDRAVQGVPC